MPSQSMIYWDSVDFESDDRSELSNSPEQTSRHYVDPWDLENYVYMRKYMVSTPEPCATPSFNGEPAESTFCYVPGPESGRNSMLDYNLDSFFYLPNEYVPSSTFAGIDETNFYNAHAPVYNINNYNNMFEDESIYYTKRVNGRNFRFYDDQTESPISSDFEEDSSHNVSDVSEIYMQKSQYKKVPKASSVINESTRRSLMNHPKNICSRRHSFNITSVFDEPNKFRSNSNHKSNSLYGKTYNKNRKPFDNTTVNSQRSSYVTTPHIRKIYNDPVESDNIYGFYTNYRTPFFKQNELMMPVPIYDKTYIRRQKPNNFGLSNYGHLKIDYSFNWTTLDQFIHE